MTILLLLAVLAQANSLGSPVGDLKANGLSVGGGTIIGNMCVADDVEFQFGDACGDYEIRYDLTGTEFELMTSDSDGAGADLVLLSIDDGVDDICLPNDNEQLQFGADCGTDADLTWDGDSFNIGAAAVEVPGSVCVAVDSTTFSIGAACSTDSTIQFDGTNVLLNSSGNYVYNTNIERDTGYFPEDSGAMGCIRNMGVSATPTAGDEMSYQYCIDSRAVMEIRSEADSSGGIQNNTVEMYDSSGNGLYWREFHTTAAKVDPGGSGATLTIVNTSSLTFLLNANTEYLYFGIDMHEDWDAASDVVIEISVALSGAETANDIINGEVVCEYFTDHDDMDTSVKTQTRTINHDIVSDNGQGDVHTLVFILDYDLASNVIEINDELLCRFRLDSVGGGTDVAAVWFIDANIKYRTPNPAIEIDSFPSEG
jgi:hypothetical protein